MRKRNNGKRIESARRIERRRRKENVIGIKIGKEITGMIVTARRKRRNISTNKTAKSMKAKRRSATAKERRETTTGTNAAEAESTARTATIKKIRRSATGPKRRSTREIDLARGKDKNATIDV